MKHKDKKNVGERERERMEGEKGKEEKKDIERKGESPNERGRNFERRMKEVTV
jgi:hypothetical protein